MGAEPEIADVELTDYRSHNTVVTENTMKLVNVLASEMVKSEEGANINNFTTTIVSMFLV